MAPEGIESGGIRPARSDGNFFCRARPLFGYIQVQLFNRFGERFRDVCTVRSISSLIFFLLTVPLCPAICRRRGHVPSCIMESAPL